MANLFKTGQFVKLKKREGRTTGFINGRPNCVDIKTIEVYGWCKGNVQNHMFYRIG